MGLETGLELVGYLELVFWEWGLLVHKIGVGDYNILWAGYDFINNSSLLFLTLNTIYYL